MISRRSKTPPRWLKTRPSRPKMARNATKAAQGAPMWPSSRLPFPSKLATNLPNSRDLAKNKAINKAFPTIPKARQSSQRSPSKLTPDRKAPELQKHGAAVPRGSSTFLHKSNFSMTSFLFRVAKHNPLFFLIFMEFH